MVLVVDGQAGLHPSDAEVLAWLRQHHPSKPVVLAVNKCESTSRGPTQVRGGRERSWSRVAAAGLRRQGCCRVAAQLGWHGEQQPLVMMCMHA